MSLKELGSPSVTVLLIPWEDVVGNLEALIYPAAREGAGANAACVDAFAACAGVDNWTKDTSKTEMKLRSLLALNEDNPFIGLGRVWSEQLIPISHPTFQQVGDAIDLFLT
jgi:hypothetical protein